MPRFLFRSLYAILLGSLFLLPSASLSAQQPAASPARQAHAAAVKDEHMDAPENNSEIEQYRHSAVVQLIARRAHVSTETAAQIFEDFNSGVLLFAIFAFLFKALPKMFRNRTHSLQKDLSGARQATEDANRRLSDVEARLLRLDTEVDAIRNQVEAEAAQEEKRIHAALEAERERIIASAEQEIAAAQSTAQRELKKFAADLAVDHALRRIQITADADRTLIREFGKSLQGGSGGKA